MSKASCCKTASGGRLRLIALAALGLVLIAAGLREAHLGIRGTITHHPIVRLARKRIRDLEVSLAITDPKDKPSFIYEGSDAKGVQLYKVTWHVLGSHPFAIRVLKPNNPSANYPHSFLFVLPVEPGLAQSTYGSGLDELQKLGAQNQYNATIIEPIFPNYSWYADNFTDPTMDYETFTGKLLPEWVDSNLANSGTEQNLLIGFSKSGYGALDLLFKHPSVFRAAAAWDFPADMTSADEYDGDENYGTEANFQNNYRLTSSFIDTWKAPFTKKGRIWISGCDTFQTDIIEFDALLKSRGVAHTLGTKTVAAHTWSGGWLSPAVAGLYGLEFKSGSALYREPFTIGPKNKPGTRVAPENAKADTKRTLVVALSANILV